jgi:hypothetical protein
VLALAADEPARRAATGLARPAPWRDTGATPDLVWGLCAGSGSSPYQIIVELDGPAYQCSCPSRKLPCKHALGLLLTWANGEVPNRAEPSDYALAWAAERRARAQKAAARRAAGADENDLAAGIPADPQAARQRAEAVRKREEAAAARRAQRAGRVTNGLSELEEWLRDQVRIGLPAAVGPSAGGHADVMAARMVDAQAPGVAGVLRDLSVVPLSGEGWPGRLLAGYAQLHLLARAHERLDRLPASLAATVRSRIGYTTGRQEVLAEPAVADRWLVIGIRDIPDATVPARRVWVRGAGTGRFALLLAFAVNGAWSDPDTAMLPLGTGIDADLHFYPGQPALRAIIGQRRTAPAPDARPDAEGGIDGLLADWAEAIAADPWLTNWPALLAGTPVAADADSGQPWHLVDADGAALPLRYAESLWTLLAVSGGHPVTIAGEWQPDALTPLTVWHGDQAVGLLWSGRWARRPTTSW